MRGLSDETGSWKMICISRLSARSSDVPIDLTSRPSNVISPDVGSMRRSSVRPVVVFPQPDSPTTPSVSPRATSNDTSFTACTAPTSRAKIPFLMGNDFFEIPDGDERLSVVHAAPTPSSTTIGVWG